MSEEDRCPVCGSADYELHGIGITDLKHPELGEIDVPMVAACFSCGHQEDVRAPQWKNRVVEAKYHLAWAMDALQGGLREAFLAERVS